MEIILGIAIIALVAYVFTRKKDVVEANAEVDVQVAPTIVALGEPPATVVIEGAGAVEIVPVADAVAPVVTKKPRAKKPAAPKAPRAKKAPKA